MLRTVSLGQLPVAQPRISSFRSVSALVSAFEAVTEGLAASRQYQQSRSRGLGHDAAIRAAFGIGPARAHGIQTLAFAGRA